MTPRSPGPSAQASTRRLFRVLACGAVLVSLLLAGCSAQAGHDHDHDHTHDRGDDQRSLAYLEANYPTREQMLRVRACVAARTGHDYPPLPADFGPKYLYMKPPAAIAKSQPPPEADAAYTDCIFDLGLEDRFFPPWQHEAARQANSS